MARRFRYAGPRTRPSPFAHTLDTALLSGPVRRLSPDELAAYEAELLARDDAKELREPKNPDPAPRKDAHIGT